MKIIAPVKSAEYIEKYVTAGADEFYGGIFDSRWQQEYGCYIEYNRRGSYGEKANCSDWKELEQMVKLSGDLGKSFYLTVNALRIAEKQREILFQILDDYKKIGGKKIIISDISLIEPLRKMELEITISSCSNIRNMYSAKLMSELGCERVIFPRDITIHEIAEIKKEVPTMEYEVFISNSGCKFSDGNCLGLHGTEMGALCDFCKRTPSEYYRTDHTALSAEEETMLQKQRNNYNNLFSHACAYCSIYELSKVADSAKIVGRVGNEQKILDDIRMAKENVQIALSCSCNEEYLNKMTKPENGDRCKEYKNCYFRTDMMGEHGTGIFEIL